MNLKKTETMNNISQNGSQNKTTHIERFDQLPLKRRESLMFVNELLTYTFSSLIGVFHLSRTLIREDLDENYLTGIY
jgi:hypothetical protein